jgi:hypothetical protein
MGAARRARPSTSASASRGDEESRSFGAARRGPPRLDDLMHTLLAIVRRARAGHLHQSDLGHPTFTVTSRGELEVQAVFPAIVPPLVAIASVVVAEAASAATAQKCEVAKLRAAGKEVRAKMVCYAKAKKTATSIDSTCLTNAQAKADATINPADGACGGTATDIDAAVDKCVSAFLSDDPGNGSCPARSAQVIGKGARGELACQTNDVRTPGTFCPDAVCAPGSSGCFVGSHNGPGGCVRKRKRLLWQLRDGRRLWFGQALHCDSWIWWRGVLLRLPVVHEHLLAFPGARMWRRMPEWTGVRSGVGTEFLCMCPVRPDMLDFRGRARVRSRTPAGASRDAGHPSRL